MPTFFMDIGVKSHQKYQQTHINTTFKELYTMIIVEVAMIKAITRKIQKGKVVVRGGLTNS